MQVTVILQTLVTATEDGIEGARQVRELLDKTVFHGVGTYVKVFDPTVGKQTDTTYDVNRGRLVFLSVDLFDGNIENRLKRAQDLSNGRMFLVNYECEFVVDELVSVRTMALKLLENLANPKPDSPENEWLIARPCNGSPVSYQINLVDGRVVVRRENA